MLSSSATLLLAFLAFSIPPSSRAVADPSTTTDLLWPLPRNVTFGSTIYSFSSSSFQFLGAGDGGASGIVKNAFERYLRLIFKTPVPFYPSGSGGSSAGVLDSVTVNVKSSDETLGPDTDESCKLFHVCFVVVMFVVPYLFCNKDCTSFSDQLEREKRTFSGSVQIECVCIGYHWPALPLPPPPSLPPYPFLPLSSSLPSSLSLPPPLLLPPPLPPLSPLYR